MELWIRSQNKNNLTQAGYIEYSKWNNENRIYINGDIFGKYKTKERAIEILDEIQEIIQSPKIHIEDDVTYYMPNDGSMKLYEMPEE